MLLRKADSIHGDSSTYREALTDLGPGAATFLAEELGGEHASTAHRLLIKIGAPAVPPVQMVFRSIGAAERSFEASTARSYGLLVLGTLGGASVADDLATAVRDTRIATFGRAAAASGLQRLASAGSITVPPDLEACIADALRADKAATSAYDAEQRLRDMATCDHRWVGGYDGSHYDQCSKCGKRVAD
jgi:hypothetical protein